MEIQYGTSQPGTNDDFNISDVVHHNALKRTLNISWELYHAFTCVSFS